MSDLPKDLKLEIEIAIGNLTAYRKLLLEEGHFYERVVEINIERLRSLLREVAEDGRA